MLDNAVLVTVCSLWLLSNQCFSAVLYAAAAAVVVVVDMLWPVFLCAGPHSTPPKRVTLPAGSERGVVDVACSTLTPITLTAAVKGQRTTVGGQGPGGTDYPSWFCGAPPCVNDFTRLGVPLIINTYPQQDPYQIVIDTEMLSYSFEITSADFNASTTCLLANSSYAEDPVVTQGVGSFTITGGSLTDSGKAFVNCYAMVSSTVVMYARATPPW